MSLCSTSEALISCMLSHLILLCSVHLWKSFSLYFQVAWFLLLQGCVLGGAGHTKLWAGPDSGAAVSRWGPSPSRGGSWPVSAAIWGQDSAAEAPGYKPCPSVPALKGCWLRPARLLPVTPSGTAPRWAPARRTPSSSVRDGGPAPYRPSPQRGRTSWGTNGQKPTGARGFPQLQRSGPTRNRPAPLTGSPPGAAGRAQLAGTELSPRVRGVTGRSLDGQR